MGMPTHLSASDIEEFGREMDAIRNEIADSLGSKDRAYILSVIKWQRTLMLAGRIVVFLDLRRLAAILGGAAVGCRHVGGFKKHREHGVGPQHHARPV